MSRILVFDSGVGGLSVLAEVRMRLPFVSVTYFADTGGFPYGSWSETRLLNRIRDSVGQLIRREVPDIVVLACNTASTLALSVLRRDYPGMIFVGTVPALKPAAALSSTGTVGLLATPGTARSLYIDDLWRSVAPGCVLIRVGSVNLAAMAEAKMRGCVLEREAVWAEIASLFDSPELDVVVLGCTHYPFILSDLMAVAPRPVIWLDSGAAVARQTERLLRGKGVVSGPTGEDRVFVSAPVTGLDVVFKDYALPDPKVFDLRF